MAEASSNKGLGDVSSVVSTRSVDLGGVLSRVSTTSMRAPATIGVDNNLSSSHTSISGRTSNVELARGVNHVFSVFVEELSRADLLDDLLDEGLSDLSVLDRGVVLGRDQNVEDLNGLKVLSILTLLVLNNDLGLAVGSEPSDLATLSASSHLHVDSAGELM